MAAAVKKVCDKMYYRMLGNTGLQVSVLSFGFWATFGVKDDLQKRQGINKAKDILRVARTNGVNLFDNAETYGNPQGEAERIMGEAIEELRAEDPKLWRRSDLIITTKLFWGGDGVNEKGLSRKHIMEGINTSLKNLREDYVDLLFCHRPDPWTPTETVVAAMTEVVRNGKAMAWGTSEWSAQQITEACWIAKTQGLLPPQFEQPQYSLLVRDRFEKEYAPLYKAPYNIGTTIWSPLKSGILTGKYADGIPENSRLTLPDYGWLRSQLEGYIKDGSMERVNVLTKFAKEKFNCSVGTLALAWCLKNKNVSTVLMGATTVEQLEENFASLEVALKLTTEDMEAIDKIMGNKPEAWQGPGGAGMRSIVTF